MTNEEASTVLKNSASTLKDGIKFLKEPHQNQFKEAYEMAIQALEYDDVAYHEEHGEVIVDKDVWEDAKRALEQEPMRDATPEERESTAKYIKSISKPTGVKFEALEQEPCEDAVSRQAFDEIKELMTDINGDTVYAVKMSDIRQLPSVNPQEPQNKQPEISSYYGLKSYVRERSE